MRFQAELILACLLGLAAVVLGATTSTSPITLSALTAKSIEGADVPLSKYAGKVLLIVNVASECGYTDSNYKELNELHKRYHSQGLRILAFPCNQFGSQEPGSALQIKQFCSARSVKFDVFDKVDVNGPQEHQLFQWLKSKKPGDIRWNFEKWVVDRKGEVVHRVPSAQRPSALEPLIVGLLMDAHDEL